MNFNKLLVLLLLFCGSIAAQNSLVVQNVTGGPGEISKINIALENESAVAGFQFTLKVPNDLILKEKEISFIGRNTDHVIYPKNNGNGEYLFICFSATNDNFTGNTGDFIEIPIEFPLDYLPGETYNIELENVILSSDIGEDVGNNHQDGVLTVIEGASPDLVVENIRFPNVEMAPNETFTVSWIVNNIGEISALGGWREQIYISSVSNPDKEYLVYTDSYNGNLNEASSITRTTPLNIPSVLRIDGEVKIKIELVPYATVKEIEAFTANNISYSSSNATLEKKILLSINKSEITKNSGDNIRVDIKRSGDTSISEEFTVTSTANDFFELPLTVVLGENQSSNFAYISLVAIDTYTGSQEITLTASGGDYNEETTTFTLIEDQKINLAIDYLADYTSNIGDAILFTLTANNSNTIDKIITISSNQSSRISFPTEVILPAGETSITFEGTILDPGYADRKQEAIIYATATDYVTASKAITLDAVNVPDFELILEPDTISEGDGLQATYINLSRTTHIDKKIAVSISADKEDRLILPETLVFEEGEQEKRFNVGAVNNSTVEGDQVINVFSTIQFSECNCTDPTDTTTVTSAPVTIIDNDGLALTLKASPSTIKAGTKNNLLIIGRNVTNTNLLENAVQVTLSSNLASVVDLPTSVTIPAGEMEVEVSFDTNIDASLNGDQSVRIEANATGYASGFSWILVTDQNEADVVISDIQLSNEVEGGAVTVITTAITNQGYADFDANAKLAYYVSKNNDITDLDPFRTSILPEGITSRETYNFSEEVELPVISGELNVIVVVNSDNAITELLHTNNQNQKGVNFLPAYGVSIALDKAVYASSENVIITGEAKTTQTNESVAISDVEITITNGEFERVFTTVTNNNGAFSYEFEPVKNESGNYSVKASYPGADVDAQSTFDILGFEIVDKEQYIKWEPFVDFPLEKQFVLKNNTSVDLTGVSISLPEDAVFEIEQTPISIGAGQQIAFNFNIISREAQTEVAYIETPITITSNEGGTYTDIVYFYSKEKDANLVATPISIQTTMVKDMARNYEFTIQNLGDVDAVDVAVEIPAAEWITLKSPELISSIKAGEEAKILLEFKPTVKEQLNVPISGTFSFKASNSKALNVPFRIETVSEETGSITVDVTDEYTYNTALAPHLAGAQVEIRHPYTGEIVAEGITGENGLFEVPTINEGFYIVNVSAEKHEEYQATVLVDPGRTLFVEAFIRYQAITYSWDVVRTEIEDEYEITLVTEFETNIPKPVIVMEIDNSKLDLEPGETRQINLTITNHGLIEAYNVNLNHATGGGDYEVKFLIESLDTLPAKSTVIVPIILSRPSSTLGAKSLASLDDDGDCSFLDFILDALFFCQGDIQVGAQSSMDKYGDCFPDITGGPRGPGGPGGGGGGGFGGGGYRASAVNVTFPNVCDPCFGGLVGSVVGCLTKTAVGCTYGILSSSGIGSFLLNVAGCAISIYSTPLGCTWSISTALGGCGYSLLSGKGLSNLNNLSTTSSNTSVLEVVNQDFQKMTDARDAIENTVIEYFQDSTIVDKDGYQLFISEIAPFIDNQTSITNTDINLIKQNLTETDIDEVFLDSFFTRWNTTIEAWDQNIFSPNTTYSNIISKIKLEEYSAVRASLATYTTERGFVSVDEMYESGFNAVQDYIDEKSADESSVCATITIEFPQTLTMTREAFEGTLTIDNASDKNLTDVLLDLVVTNELGENKTDLFQINKDAFLDGAGIVNASDSGSGIAIFIPTKEAAPQVAQSYSFGGVLSYYDEEVGDRVSITLNPVTLEVNPSPDLILDYFLQRNIFGDDALTEDVVEPSLPAELSLMITNDGYGVANNVAVESMQPEIVDNEKGLAIEFEMIGSNFNNEPKELGLLEVDYGTIGAKTSSVGQWYFTSSLLGHFVSYDIRVNHVSDFSNENLSLIKEANIHELIKSVRVYEDGNDDIADFLVNDIGDSKDTPDRIYLSNGTSEEVFESDLVTSSNNISSANLTTQITINPFTTGWNYGYITDPGADVYKLYSVVRNADGVEIPLDNFWQTSVTLRDGLNPKYENNLHVLDEITAITTYTLTYVPVDDNMPIITAIEGVPDSESASEPLELFTVTFNKEVDVNTFTPSNISLVSQGNNIDTDNILIGRIDETTYSISLQGLTETSGFYELTISSVGVKDTLGNEGQNAERVSWIQFLNELGILKFESDQINNLPINSVAVTFNKEIRSEEFTIDKLTINGNPVDDTISITQIDEYNYSISGIDTFNQEDRDYNLAIDLTTITAVDGSEGLAVQNYDWIVDNNLPEIVTIEPIVQAGLHDQHITEINIELNRKLSSGIQDSAFTFTKDREEINIPISIVEIDDLNYKILGLSDYTLDNGTYNVSIDQSSLQDEVDNFGIGLVEESWTVNVNTLIGIGNLNITPDRGALDDDNITSGNDIQLSYETLENDLTIKVYELVATSEILIDESLRATQGEYFVPLENQLGAKRYKVVAIDQDGNISDAQVISTYIDFSDIDVTIEPIKELDDNECYDFDYVHVSFSEEIEEGSFNNDAIQLTSSGISIPNDNITITQIGVKNYRLENITYEGDGIITIEIDKTKIIKNTSGLAGLGSAEQELGVSKVYETVINGEANPLLGTNYTYLATEGLSKYDWIILNGEIVSSNENSVEVKWNVEGEHVLMLRFQTPLGCTSAKQITVDVEEDVSLSQETFVENLETSLSIGPNPNKGKFTIHTNKQFGNCEINIYNIVGENVYSKSEIAIDKEVIDIEITNVASGVYILVISNENEKIDFKIMID